MKIKKKVIIGVAATITLIALITCVNAIECPPGFTWKRMSGVGCVQEDCFNIEHARYSYTERCICNEGYKSCYVSVDYAGFDKSKCGPFCPGAKLIACIKPGESCPSEKKEKPVPKITPKPTPKSTLKPTLEITQEKCDKLCLEKYGTGAMGVTIDGKCKCKCNEKEGYVFDETRTKCIKEESPNEECDKYCRERHGTGAYGTIEDGKCKCKCDSRRGYVPDKTGTKCINICNKECKEIFSGSGAADIASSGTYPNCECVAGYRDDLGRLTKIVKIVGDRKTTYILNPKTGDLIKKETTLLSEEKHTEKEVRTQGIIDKVIEYDIDDLDENACSPIEYAYQRKTRDGKTITACGCKPGYKRVKGGCMFDKPEDAKLSNGELKQLELTLSTLSTNQHSTIEVIKDGKFVKLGILRRGDQSLVYTLDGKTWDSELKNLLNPGIWYKAGRLIGSIGNAINPVNWFETSYIDKDKQMQYEVAGETLKAYKKTIKKPKHFNQHVYEYYKSAEDKKAAIETIQSGGMLDAGRIEGQSTGIIGGTGKVVGGKLKNWAMTFPGEAVAKFADEAQTQQIADGFFVYARMRETTQMSPQKIMNDEEMIGVRGQWGLEASLGEVLLCQLYEESYQRYLLRKKI